MLAFSKYWKRARKFTNLPKSPIRFDKDRIAKFVDTKVSKKAKTVNKGRLYQIAKMRLEGLKYTDISDKLNVQATQITREVNKILRFYVDYVDSLEDSKEFVNKIEQSSLEETSSN